MLAGVGEVDAEQLDVAARRRRSAAVGVDPHDVAAEGHDDVLERRVAADRGAGAGQVHGVVVPVLHADDGEVGAVADQRSRRCRRACAVPRVVEHDDAGRDRARRRPQVCAAPRRVLGALRRRTVTTSGVGRRPPPGPSRRCACSNDATRRWPRRGRPACRLRPTRASSRLDQSRPSPLGRRRPRRTDAVVAGGRGRRRAAPRSRSTGVNRQSSSRPVGHREVGDVERRRSRSARDCSGTGDAGAVVECGFACSADDGRHQPTAPSICSSISRLSSRAYSIGSSRAIGSMKPRTIIAMASSSVMPRDIR